MTAGQLPVNCVETIMILELGYSYVLMVLLSIAVYGLAFKVQQFEPKDSQRLQLFQLGHVSRGGEKNESWSAIFSGLILGAFLFCGLSVLWLLQRYLGSLMSPFFLCVNLSAVAMFASKFALHYLSSWDKRAIVALSIAAGTVTAGLCVVLPCWLTYDTMALAVASFLVSGASITKIRYLVLGLAVIAFYDFTSVFGTHMMQDVAAPKGGYVPGTLFFVPLNPFVLDVPSDANTFNFLGLGDVIFPGFGIQVALQYGLQRWTVWGYVIGLAIVYASSFAFDQGFPAMIVLGPSVLCALYSGSWYRKVGLDW